MTSQRLDRRLAHVPWDAVAGELVTAACVGCFALFLPEIDWVTWPALLYNCHFAVVLIGTLAVALALFRRKPEALKCAVVLATYIGTPILLSLSQALVQVRSAADGPAGMLSYAVSGFGMIGQVEVIFSCLRRLAPTQ
jgi:hypothetical protein